jgi:hypothetical protein
MHKRQWPRLWWGLAESAYRVRNLESRDRFCVGASTRNMTSVAVNMYSNFVYVIKRDFYKLCTFNAMCKDNAAINCIFFNTNEVHSRHL